MMDLTSFVVILLVIVPKLKLKQLDHWLKVNTCVFDSTHIARLLDSKSLMTIITIA
jgi:hypothetical protein